MPMPMAANTSKACSAGRPMANPSDAPMKGAVHGEAIATASTPERNAFAIGWRASSVATLDGRKAPKSNTPARFKPISVNKAASTATTAGDCSWKPQPSSSPAARKASISAPSAANDTITPAVYAMPPSRCARRSFAC
jgi:hypothetical protein